MEGMEMRKRILVFALAFALCLALAPATAAAADAVILPSVTVEIPDSDGLRITMTNVEERCFRGNSYAFFYDEGQGSAVTFNKDLYSVVSSKGDVGDSYYETFTEYFINPTDDGDAALFAAAGAAIETADASKVFPSIVNFYAVGGARSSTQIFFYPARYIGQWEYRPQNLTPISDLSVTAGAVPPVASAATAAPTASTVLVNGRAVAFDAYNIGGSNYFKLRDLAYVLSGSAKQFEVGWDGGADAIALTSSRAYTAVGGEMASKSAENKTPAPTTSKITLNGAAVTVTAYKIDDNNYFKLRDIGQVFDFGVDWDGARNTIVIDTAKGYTPE
jgi:hypothetical protein